MKKYSKKLQFSYALGVYPTLDLVVENPALVRQVILHSKAGKNKGVNEIKKMCSQHRINIQVNDQKINQLSVKENCLALGVFEKKQRDLDSQSNHIVLVNPRNMGNLGTIIRTSLGFGVKDIAIIKPAADIWDPKVIRSTMGAIFKSNIQLFESFSEYKNKFGTHNLYAFAPDAQTMLKEVDFNEPLALVFGNESEGLKEHIVNNCLSVGIPQSEDIDSLNLAVSVGIGLYEVQNKI